MARGPAEFRRDVVMQLVELDLLLAEKTKGDKRERLLKEAEDSLNQLHFGLPFLLFASFATFCASLFSGSNARLHFRRGTRRKVRGDFGAPSSLSSSTSRMGINPSDL